MHIYAHVINSPIMAIRYPDEPLNILIFPAHFPHLECDDRLLTPRVENISGVRGWRKIDAYIVPVNSKYDRTKHVVDKHCFLPSGQFNNVMTI
jgi:hypothetical protein